MWSSSSARARTLAALAAGATAVALPAAAAPAAPRVVVTVIGPGGKVVRAPRAVRATAPLLRVGSRRCRVAEATPLAALAQFRMSLRIRGDGACSPSALFLVAIGGRANAGRNGWAYKVGHKAGTTSAGDRSGSFGDGRRLRSGQVVTWFWCVLGGRGCQRTLTARNLGHARVRVLGYDDVGRGVRIRRALVTATDSRGHRAQGRTNARGEVGLRGVAGHLRLSARRGGFVPALPGGAR